MSRRQKKKQKQRADSPPTTPGSTRGVDVTRPRPDRRNISVSLPILLVDDVDVLAEELEVGRNWVVRRALEEFIPRQRARLFEEARHDAR